MTMLARLPATKIFSHFNLRLYLLRATTFLLVECFSVVQKVASAKILGAEVVPGDQQPQ